ncbi:MAG: hypothetical protein ABIH67_00230 [Candidatus Uhrbacteria bacterium]
MKKHMPGFVPVQFRRVGTVLLVSGIICLLTRLLVDTTNSLIYFGVALTLVGLYLIFVVPNEK